MKDKKISYFTYLLAIPPLAQWFLCWYVWQAIKVLSITGYKSFVQAVYTQKAIASNMDATELNKSVESYHQEQAEEPISNLRRFENVAIAGLVLTSLFWFTMPPKERFLVVMPVQMVMTIPQAATETINNFKLRR